MQKLSDIKKQVIDAVHASESIEDAIKKINELGFDVTRDEIEMMLKGNEKQVTLNDDELATVTGGTDWYDQKLWSSKTSVQYLFKVGDTVEVASGWGFGTTVRCKIVALGIGYFSLANGGNAYFDTYYCENEEYTWWFYDGWKTRDLIEKR